MNEELDRRDGQPDLAFFGRIGADVSHEMRNVLSVIGEYAGLLDDLLAFAESGKDVDLARLKKLSANIVKQVGKGTAAMERFSRFSHAADQQSASFDLTSLAENTAALAQRSVALAGCGLETDIPDAAVPISNNPFRLQRAVFSAVQLVLPLLERGALLKIGLAAAGPTAEISVAGSNAGDAETPDLAAPLETVMAELGGSVQMSRVDQTIALTLTVPTR